MVQGTVARGWEGVRRAFEDNFRDRGEVGAGLCVYRHGERVADLWGGLADIHQARAWGPDTPVVAFSTSKGIVALVFAMLADRGSISLDAPISDYWREFAQNGKGDITLRHWLNHRSGLVALDTPLRLVDFKDPRAIDAAVERQRPEWVSGAHQGYAATAFGVVALGLMRRLTGMSLGQWMRRELAEPLGADAWIGTPRQLDGSLARIYPYGLATLLGCVAPEALLRDSHEGRVVRRLALMRHSLVGRAFMNPWLGRMEQLNRPDVQRLELPWVNGAFSARGLATIYAGLANGGHLDGVRVLSSDAIAGLGRCQSWSSRDRVMQKPMGFSQGFGKEEVGVYAATSEAFGHQGTGGSVGLADPRTGIAIGYVMNRLDWRQRSPRAVALCRAVYEAIDVPFPDQPRAPDGVRVL